MPAAGINTSATAPAPPASMEKQFEDYMHARTLSNWKFWIVSSFLYEDSLHEYVKLLVIVSHELVQINPP